MVPPIIALKKYIIMPYGKNLKKTDYYLFSEQFNITTYINQLIQ